MSVASSGAPNPGGPFGESLDRVPLWPYLVALFGLLIVGIAFGLIAKEVREAVPDGLDLRIGRWIALHRERFPTWTRCFRLATRIGDAPIAIGASIFGAIALVLLAKHRSRAARIGEAGFWLGVLASSWVLNRALKLVFERDRPPSLDRLVRVEEDSFSFPSGHAAFAGCFFGLMGILLAWRLADRTPLLRGLVLAGCLLAALIVAASRVWLSVHYVSDVLGGLALGLGWAVACWTIHYGWHHWRRRRRRSTTP